MDTGALAGPVAQLMALPHTLRVDAAEQRMFLAIRRPAPGAFRAQLLPATPAAVAAFQPHAASTVFWTAEQAPVPAVRGFALLAPEAGGAEFEAVEIWSLVFDATESVLAATQRSDGSVHSRVKVRAVTLLPVMIYGCWHTCQRCPHYEPQIWLACNL